MLITHNSYLCIVEIITVADLIAELQKLPKDIQVMLDCTPDGSEVFRLHSIVTCGEYEIETGTPPVVVLAPFDYENEDDDHNIYELSN